jgi:hypothetical protein
MNHRLLLCVLCVTAAIPARAQPIPNDRLLNQDVAVYRRSPTELWVYDTRPEVGVGAHQFDDASIEQVKAAVSRASRP